jgi:hypothetical protein
MWRFDYTSTVIVTLRVERVCGACGGIIKKGEKAFKHVWYLVSYQSCPSVHYFHFNPNTPVKQIGSMSFNDIRAKICSKDGGAKLPSEEKEV